HGVRHLVGRVTREVLGERLGIELAARLPCTARMPLRRSKHIVWKGHRCFHTPSITTGPSSTRPLRRAYLEIPSPAAYLRGHGALRSDREPDCPPRPSSRAGLRLPRPGGGGAA